MNLGEAINELMMNQKSEEYCVRSENRHNEIYNIYSAFGEEILFSITKNDIISPVSEVLKNIEFYIDKMNDQDKEFIKSIEDQC